MNKTWETSEANEQQWDVDKTGHRTNIKDLGLYLKSNGSQLNALSRCLNKV